VTARQKQLPVCIRISHRLVETPQLSRVEPRIRSVTLRTWNLHPSGTIAPRLV